MVPAEVSKALHEIAIDALKYDKNDLPSASEIYDNFNLQRNARFDSASPSIVCCNIAKPQVLASRIFLIPCVFSEETLGYWNFYHRNPAVTGS